MDATLQAPWTCACSVPQMASNLIFYRVWFLILPIPTLASCGLDGVAGAIVEDSASNVLDTQASCFFLEKVHTFPSLSLSQCTYRSFSWCPWHPWQDLILLGTFAFLTWSLAAHTISNFSVFLPGYVSLLPPFVGFLFMSEFSRRCFFLQTAVLVFFPGFLFVGMENVSL